VVVWPVTFDDEFATAPDWAKLYRSQDLQVVPAHQPSEGGEWKRPYGNWLEFQDSLVPQALFDRWYDRDKGEHRLRKAMGVITGLASAGPNSSGLVVHDLDVKAGSQAFAWWAGGLAAHNNGMDLDTPTQTTGGGGRHIFTRAPIGWAPPTFKTAIGVDLRGQGGFVIVPPSYHMSGRFYAWEPGREPWTVEIATTPDWLIERTDQLHEEFGGQPAPWTERTDAPDTAKGAFGYDVDGRDHKMTGMVFAAIVDLYRESPIPPAMPEQQAELQRIWTQYERSTKSRLIHPERSNADLLEQEGRGYTAMARKWAYLIAPRHWETKVREAARLPRPNPAPVWGERLNESVAAAISQKSDSADPEEPEPAIRLITSFVGEPPEREWLVKDWIAKGVVNSLYGGSGAGKSLLAMQIGAAMASGADVFEGLTTTAGDVLGIFCEDDADELHRRMWAIRAAMGYTIGYPFSRFALATRVGEENRLAVVDRAGNITTGPFFATLKSAVEAGNPALLILDTLADIYGGNENAREQVNWFLKTLLTGLIVSQKARGHSLTVLLIGHPSLTGAQDGGRGYSGSSAWEAGVRARLYLNKPDPGGPDDRILTRGKANYASAGDETAIRLTYVDGVFRAEGPPEDPVLSPAKLKVIEMVRWNWGAGKPFMDAKTHPRNLWKALVPPIAKEFALTRAQASQAIRELIEDGEIRLSRDHSKRGWKTSDD
jgi:hypothetical protein